MQSWKPLLAILPTGLLLGLIGGQASHPEMVMHDERGWPQSGREISREPDMWQPAYDDRGTDVYARGYSYRPDLDYDAFAWPEQSDHSAQLLAASDYRAGAVDAPIVDPVASVPEARRAVAELARAQVERLSADIGEVSGRASEGGVTEVAAATPRAFVLPPVPPPLTKADTAAAPEGDDGADDM